MRIHVSLTPFLPPRNQPNPLLLPNYLPHPLRPILSPQRPHNLLQAYPTHHPPQFHRPATLQPMLHYLPSPPTICPPLFAPPRPTNHPSPHIPPLLLRPTPFQVVQPGMQDTHCLGPVLVLGALGGDVHSEACGKM